MKNAFKKIFQKFGYSFLGFIIVLKEERSIFTYLFLGIVCIGLGIWTQISLIKWAIVLLTFFVAISVEIINTSIEATVDAISFQYNIKVKKIKDIAAAATLVITIGLIVINLLIFIPAIKGVI